jgi:PmbA protein
MTAQAGLSAVAGLVGDAGLFGEDRIREMCADSLAYSPADETEVCLTSRTGGYTRFARDRIHQPQEITEWSVQIRAVIHSAGGSWAGHAATGDPADLRAAALAATAAARAQQAAGLPGLAHRIPELEVEHGSVEHQPLPARILRPVATAAFDEGVRSALAWRAMRSAGAHGGWAAGMLGRAVTELAVASSAGVSRATTATEALGSLTVAVDGGSSHWADVDRDADVLRTAESMEQTVAEAVRARRPTVLEPGVYDVVLGPLAVGELVEALPAFGFTGADLADGVGALARRRGERVAAASVTVVDDAARGRGLPIGFDREGSSKRTVRLLDAGVVTDGVTDAATAARLAEAGSAVAAVSTGHAHIGREQAPAPTAANLHLLPGSAEIEELIAGVARGIYVQRFWYTRVVDPVATTLTGVSRDACFAIVDGHLAGPVAGARFTESVFGVLDRVDGVGRAVLSQPLMNIFNGVVTAPALRVRGFRFGAARPAATPGGDR